MKTQLFFTGLVLVAVLIGVSSCERADELPIPDLAGIYIGPFSTSVSLKNSTVKNSILGNGVAEVTHIDDKTFLIHCYGDEIDTTFMLDVYENNSEYLACQVGSEFQQEYGHTKGAQHMGHMRYPQTEWMHHLADDHEDDDKHFGEFNMEDGFFMFSFRMVEGFTPYFLNFQGVKD